MSTLVREHVTETHAVMRKDHWPNARHREARQRRVLEALLAEGRNVVVDNTNATPEDRTRSSPPPARGARPSAPRTCPHRWSSASTGTPAAPDGPGYRSSASSPRAASSYHRRPPRASTAWRSCPHGGQRRRYAECRSEVEKVRKAPGDAVPAAPPGNRPQTYALRLATVPGTFWARPCTSPSPRPGRLARRGGLVRGARRASRQRRASARP
jgi:hypothetical protein